MWFIRDVRDASCIELPTFSATQFYTTLRGKATQPQVAWGRFVRIAWLTADVSQPGKYLTEQSTRWKEHVMDWNEVAGKWTQAKGKFKEKWGQLTDDDLAVIDGKREQLEGKIQERYGKTKDQAKSEIDEWLQKEHL
jgi:uncharacterized protein YjbJ (UPF0337 family)